MKTLCLLLAAVFLTAPAAEPKDHTRNPVPTHADPGTADGFACSAIGELIRANGRIPKSLLEWKKAMTLHGDGEVRQAIVPLSRAIHPGSLAKPRIALAMVPGEKPGRLALANRLFVARAHSGTGTSLEFISWNNETGQFDFGLIDNYDGAKKIELRKVPSSECTSCHKSGGPIFSMTPWSDTTDNLNLWRAMLGKLAAADPKQYKPVLEAFDRADKKRAEKQAESDAKKANVRHTVAEFLGEEPAVKNALIEGLPLFNEANPIDGETGEFDKSVVTANSNLFFQEWVRDMTPAMRKEFLEAGLAGLAESALVGKSRHEAAVKKIVAALTPAVVAGRSKAKPFRLVDYDPFTKKLNPILDESAKEYVYKDYVAFDERRQRGEEKIPSAAQPTHDDAFLPASDILNSNVETFGGQTFGNLARLLGVNEKDLVILRGELDAALLRVEGDAAKRSLLQTQVVQEAVRNKTFQAMVAASRLPAPEHFKRTLLQALDVALAQRGVPDFAKRVRPKISHESSCRGEHDKVAASAGHGPTEACSRCHTGADATGGPLPFDPADVGAWARSLGSADGAKRKEAERLLPDVIARLESGSMPPGKDAKKAFAKEGEALLRYLKVEMGKRKEPK